MKICNKCNIEKPSSQFQVAAVIRDKTYYRKYCTSCKIKQQQVRQNKTKEYFYDLKKKLKCENCGIQDYRVLDFHHINPDEKDKPVSEMLTHGVSIKKLQDEIDKCVPMCANCHRIFHWNNRLYN